MIDIESCIVHSVMSSIDHEESANTKAEQDLSPSNETTNDEAGLADEVNMGGNEDHEEEELKRETAETATESGKFVDSDKNKAANVTTATSIDGPIIEFIRNLERHCRACELDGKYAEAEAAYKRWDELWLNEETRRR